ncbi:hypothetical protein Gogos_021663 [Gossypium gossypioides]|uniref:Hexosyltransferase n=1 Tax=Gossypium gossypioides TaxID=34282 RepID=A0A7J9D275_GOSGO|nr:hypothetical protein [Gossypium gossypioides]
MKFPKLWILFLVLLVTIQSKLALGAKAQYSSKQAYVTLLYGDEFLLRVRVLGKSIRDTGSTKDMVVLVSDGVSDYAKKLLEADGWIMENISLLVNPNQVRPKRYYSSQSIEDLFKCEKFCANLKHSERLNSGVMVVEPSEAVFNDMMSKVLKVRPVPEMERLSTLYNADVGLYMLANKWMVDESELRVIHYTLGPLKPWDWWTSWLLKPVDVWQGVFFSELHYAIRHLYFIIRSSGTVAYSGVSSSSNINVNNPTKVPVYLGGISVFVCFMAVVVSLGISIAIVPRQRGRRIVTQLTPVSADTDLFNSDSKIDHRQAFSCDIVSWYYGLGMAFLAIVAPSLPCIFGITALFLRLGLMVVEGIILASFVTYASEHLAIRSFLKGCEDLDTTQSRECFLC